MAKHKAKAKHKLVRDFNVIVGHCTDGQEVTTPLERINVTRRLDFVHGLSMLRIAMSHDHPLREKIGSLLEEIADATAPLVLKAYGKKGKR
jgi:hypothetical protein